jgi:hypothetical protein
MTRYSPKTGQPTEYQVGPYNAAHLYVQWGGKLPGGETWSCGFRLRKKTPGAVDNGSALLAGVTAALSSFHADTQTQISSAAKLSFVKVNAIGVDGKYSGTGTNESIVADIGGATSGGPRYPNQVAWGVTLLTGFSRGAAHKGRFYLPLPTCQLTSDTRISPADATSLATRTGVLIDNINVVNADYEMAIFSRKDGAPGNRRVIEAEAGRVLDTQRRRRRSLVEDYQ